ncbi:hypothetical protein [Silvibacterium dinghuense]|uniref:Uncharacterized protein n=1 Tax=Silvibacterium dinghuense TaxID=1560006 RepID=A0A4Q1SHR3_9BACT|nr:hypothetical protein [Silvibacterium dinghuense]RXS96907.1 hypothetical protein ESZ00_02910 [Silvibacterium dinghuense]GGG94587.1 hypothetical protein GCM10011586_06880 [Silvibacterium dinghuense]
MYVKVAVLSFLLWTGVGGPVQSAPAASAAQEPEYINSFRALAPDGSLKPLEQQQMAAATKVHGLGYGGAETVYAVEGEKSPVRFTAATLPPMIVKLPSPDIDPSTVVHLYQLTPKKGKREVQVAKAHLFTGGKSTLAGEQISMNFAKYGTGSVKVIPAAPLAPGEYALMTQGSMQAFCFGLD